MAAVLGDPASPESRSVTDPDSGTSVDTLLASALQRNMSFSEDRKRQHTPGTANRPRRFRKAADLDCDDLKENNDPVAPSTKKVTPSRLACIKQLEQEMTCSVCLDICVRPCTTPCGHDFCRKCLKQALQHQRRCPKCRTPIATNAPICINTVLWNTIKLLFPKHAANAPDSPADAILTPSSANNAALVANAVAALPMRRIGLIHAPFNPPRRVQSYSPHQRPQTRPQRAPPSWLEGATRDSDPPASGQRHRLALSSHQQTLPQALGRWGSHAGRAEAGGGPGDGMAHQGPAAPAPQALQPTQNHASFMQGSRSAHANRDGMPSLLDNLQRRLDDLPVPDILHRPYGHPAQEVAAGLEASPRLRVRAFPPQAQQLVAPGARGPFVRPQRIPSSRQQHHEGQGASRQPHMAAAPAWSPHAEAQAQGFRGDMRASDAWLSELPDTPEAPRAASAAERQAAADLLFEEAAGQSAVADSETVSEDPSWLDDAAAYDAAAAVAEVDDDLSALELLSEDDDTPVNGARSQARLNLSHLEHLMLLSDSEEDDGGVSDAEDPALSDRQHAGGQDGSSQAGGLQSSDTEVQAVDGHDEEIQSDNEVAVGHDGRLRIVLSDVTSRFPAEQLPQVPDDVISKPAEAAGSFQLQRRGGQGRVCRSLLSAGSDTPNGTGLQAGNSLPADCNAQAAAMVKPAVRSSTRLQAGALAAPCPQAVESTASDSQSGICTRRQAKLNKRSSQQSPRQQVKLSHEAASSDVDFAVVGRSQHQGRAANLAPPTHLTSNLEPSRSEATNSCAQTGLAEKPSAVRRNRPRLQLNRKPKDMGNASQASTSSTSHTTQH